MLKHILATSALATLLATGAHAQEQTATDPAQDPAAPVMEGTQDATTGDAAADTTTVTPEVVESDPATAPEAPLVTQEGTTDPAATDPAATEMTQDPATDPAATDPAATDMTQDPAATDPAATDMTQDPATDPAATDMTQDPATDPAAPVVTQDPATDPAAPAIVEDDTMAPADGTVVGQDPAIGTSDTMAAEGWSAIDLATVSADRLMGADIVNYNNESVATIDDVLISDSGQVESLVARFGGFLGFGANRVLLTMDEIEIMQDANENLMVRTNLTPEAIEGRPDYERS